MEEGTVLAILVRRGEDLSVQVLGEPSREVAEALLQAGAAYARFVEGQ